MVPIFGGGKVMDAGVDWITATGKEAETCESLLSIGQTLATLQEGCGFCGQRQHFQGYSGYGAEGVFYGTRPDGACLRVSGSLAHLQAAAIARVPAHISRVDLQVTVLLGEAREGLAHELVNAWRADRRRAAAAAQRRSELIDTGRHGSTAGFGARTSALFGRVYDKHKESTGAYPAGAWRAEVEVKRKLGSAIFGRLAGYEFSKESVIGFVRQLWARLGVELEIPGALAVDVPVVPRQTTDHERKLLWLRTTAAPVVRQLHEAGRGADAASALYSWLMNEGDAGEQQAS